MADAFRDALKKPTAIAPAPAPAKPAEPKPDPASKPAPKPPETKPAAAPAPVPAPGPSPEKVEPTAPELKGKAREAWDKLETTMRTHKAEADKYKSEREELANQTVSLKAELETLKKGSAEYERVKSEFDGTKKQLEEFQGIINRFALEQDPRFKNHYDNRIKQLSGTAKDFITGAALTKFEEIAALPMSRHKAEQIKAFIAEMDETDRMAATAAANIFVQMQSIELERQGELAKSSENLAQARTMALKQQQEEQAQRQSHLKAVVDLAHQQIAPELDGSEESEAAAFKETTRKLVFGELDQKDLLHVAVYAAKGRKYDSAIAALKEENAKLQSQVAELTASNIPANGTGGGERVQRRNGPHDNSDIGPKFQTALAQRQGRK